MHPFTPDRAAQHRCSIDVRRKLLLVSVVAATALPFVPAHAQYKVVAPDGSVTYTDRPPADARLRVTPMGSATGATAAIAAPAVNLPVELRQLTQRFPVSLYTSADCPACDSGRQWLAERGVPYRERSISTEPDVQALALLTGARTVPALTIGAQPVRGFSAGEWQSFIDAAGYPRESRLPSGWQPPAVTPLVEPPPPPAVVATPAPRPAAPPPPPPAAPAPGPGGVRF